MVQVEVDGEGWVEVDHIAAAAKAMRVRVENSGGARMVQWSEKFDFWSFERIVFVNFHF